MRPRVLDDLNRSLTTETYSAALRLISEHLAKNFVGYSLYQFGHCKYPGISDLDMLVVLDSSDSANTFRQGWGKLKEEILFGKYLFWHDPIIVSQGEIPALRLFHTSENPKYIAGNEISIGDAVGIPQILIWNSYFYKAFFSFMNHAEVSLRYAHLLLNTLGYSVRNNDRIYGTEYFSSFSSAISKLREDELKERNSEDASELMECFARGLKIIETQENRNKSIVWPWHRYRVRGPECSYQMGSSFRYLQGEQPAKFIYPKRYFDLYHGFLDPTHQCVFPENQQYLNVLKRYLADSKKDYKEQLSAFVAVGIFDNDICKIGTL